MGSLLNPTPRLFFNGVSHILQTSSSMRKAKTYYLLWWSSRIWHGVSHKDLWGIKLSWLNSIASSSLTKLLCQIAAGEVWPLCWSSSSFSSQTLQVICTLTDIYMPGKFSWQGVWLIEIVSQPIFGTKEGRFETVRHSPGPGPGGFHLFGD